MIVDSISENRGNTVPLNVHATIATISHFRSGRLKAHSLPLATLGSFSCSVCVVHNDSHDNPDNDENRKARVSGGGEGLSESNIDIWGQYFACGVRERTRIGTRIKDEDNNRQTRPGQVNQTKCVHSRKLRVCCSCLIEAANTRHYQGTQHGATLTYISHQHSAAAYHRLSSHTV